MCVDQQGPGQCRCDGEDVSLDGIDSVGIQAPALFTGTQCGYQCPLSTAANEVSAEAFYRQNKGDMVSTLPIQFSIAPVDNTTLTLSDQLELKQTFVNLYRYQACSGHGYCAGDAGPYSEGSPYSTCTCMGGVRDGHGYTKCYGTVHGHMRSTDLYGSLQLQPGTINYARSHRR